MMTTVMQRKASYFGYIIRNGKYSTQNLKENIGKESEIRTEKNLRQWANMTPVELFQAAVDKVRGTNVIANILKG